MSKGLLDPKVDFVFKNIFGSEKNPQILISFLNATLKPIKKITKVEIKGTDIGKQFIEDKYSRLDIKATTGNNEIRSAKDELIRMSNDEKERSIYDMRAKILKDKVSALNNAERNGEINKAKVGIRNMLAKGMDSIIISEILEVSIELVESVAKE